MLFPLEAAPMVLLWLAIIIENQAVRQLYKQSFRRRFAVLRYSPMRYNRLALSRPTLRLTSALIPALIRSNVGCEYGHVVLP